MESISVLFSLEMSPMLQTTNYIHPIFRDDIVVNDPQHLGELLDQAVQRIIPTALERRQGILVTQLFPNKYTVEVHEGVPCGMIEEKRINPDTA